MCHAEPYRECVSYGAADRDDDYRSTNPHRLRRNDAWKKINPRVYLAFVGTQTRVVRSATKTQAFASVKSIYQARGYRLRKSEINIRRATVEDIGWLTDAGEHLLAQELALALPL